MCIAGSNIGITGVHALLSPRFIKSDSRQSSFLQVGQKVFFIFQMFSFSRGAIAVGFEIGERLVMELEQGIGFSGHSLVPAAGIPGPADVLGAKSVADGRHFLWRQQPGAICKSGRMRLVEREQGIDSKTSSVTSPSLVRRPLASCCDSIVSGAWS